MKLYHFFYIILFIWGFNTYGQEANNPHKFSAANWEFTEWCNPCHAYDSETSAPSDRFLLSYESDSLSSTDSTYISGISKLCFTCHDGTVAQFSHSADLSQLRLSVGGSSIENAHPVSVVYPANGHSNVKLHNPKTTLSGLGGTIAEDMLKNGRVECVSCHDAHFSMQTIPCGSCPTTNLNQQTGNKPNSLLMSNENGALCLTCHDL